MILAVQFGWTPEEVGRLDPSFVEELMQRISAENKLEKKRAEQSAKAGK